MNEKKTTSFFKKKKRERDYQFGLGYILLILQKKKKLFLKKDKKSKISYLWATLRKYIYLLELLRVKYKRAGK